MIPGMPFETLRHSLRAPAWQIEAVLAALTRERRLRCADGIAALPGFAPRAAGGQAELDRIVEILAQAGLTPPSIAELERLTALSRSRLPCSVWPPRAGRVEAVERDRYYAREALDRFTDVLRGARPGQRDIVPAAVRDRLGISRKYLIPLLEWADAKGLTVRVGDGRRLRSTS